MMKKKLFLFVFPILAVMLFFTLSAHATLIESGLPGGGADQTGLPPGDTLNTIQTKIITPAQYVRYLYLFVMGFVGIAGLVTLIIWGTVWTASGVVDKKTAAMEGIKNTLYGIGIALSAYILLYTINPDLTIIRTPTFQKIDTNIKIPTSNGCTAKAPANATGCLWVQATLEQASTPSAACKLVTETAIHNISGDYCAIQRPSGINYFCCMVPATP